MSGIVNPFSGGRIAGLTQRVRATTQKSLVELTRTKTAENQTRIAALMGVPAPTRLYVDGSLGKPLEQAQLMTLTEFDLTNNIVDVALHLLFERSPVGPEKGGHYRDDHWLYVNGQRRDATPGNPIELRASDEVVIINMRPYARRLEGGPVQRFRRRLTNRRPGLSVQAPNGIYEITAQDLKRRFSGVATIRFTFRGLMGGGEALIAASGPRKARRERSGRFAFSGGPRSGLPQNRFPAIEITAKV